MFFSAQPHQTTENIISLSVRAAGSVTKEEVTHILKQEVTNIVKEEVKNIVKEEAKNIVKEEVTQIVNEDVVEIMRQRVAHVLKEEISTRMMPMKTTLKEISDTLASFVRSNEGLKERE